MAIIKIGKSIKQINAQADRLIELSQGNEARIAHINAARAEYLKNIQMTAYHRKWCKERDEYATKKDDYSRHKYYETCRRIEDYGYGFSQYTHIHTNKRARRNNPKHLTYYQREAKEALDAIAENGQEPLGRDAIKEMRAIKKMFTIERTRLHKEKSIQNKEHRAVVYKRRKQQLIDNGEIKEN